MTDYSTEIDKTKLLNAIAWGEPGTKHRYTIIMRLLELNINTLSTSIDQASIASTKLAKRVFWLNVILTLVGIGGLVVSILHLLRQT